MSKASPPYLGAAYYPEDWPLAQIDQDIALMKEAGMNVMRVAEFAWSCLEPEEGKYKFDWLKLVVDKLTQADIAVVMCTPTCTPPIWLAEKNPEILFMNESGVRAQHGARRHACPSSPVYREYCGKIVTRMAEEFGRHDNIVAWQIDNELYPGEMDRESARGCCCPVCQQKFRQWLKKRFKNIDELNRAWGTNLWSQTYQSFEQISAPRKDTWHHPSLLTAWMIFQSDSYVDFCDQQAAILHRLTEHPVGTDMMPFNGLNYHQINRNLDLAMFNHYHGMRDLWGVAFWMDFLRPLKDTPFWNTETATCWNGAVTANGYKEPGFCRVNSWLPLALGGEANLYWLWRAHWSGQELMHGSVVDACGRPLHIIGEVRELSVGFKKSADFLNHTRPVTSGLAIHFSGHAWWTFMFQPMVNNFRYAKDLQERVYAPIIEAQLRPDVIDPAAEIDDYKVICSPFLPALDEALLRERIKAWIENGGTWIVGPLSDNRTLHAAKFTQAPFGSLEEWAGIYCKYQIPGDPRQFTMRWTDSTESPGAIWYDGFELKGAQALATYIDGPLQGLAAVARKKMGKGSIIVLGTMPQPAAFKQFILSVTREAGIQPAAVADPNLLVVPRHGDAGEGMVVVELKNTPATLQIDGNMTDLLTGRAHSGTVPVAPYGVMVLKK